MTVSAVSTLGTVVTVGVAVGVVVAAVGVACLAAGLGVARLGLLRLAVLTCGVGQQRVDGGGGGHCAANPSMR